MHPMHCLYCTFLYKQQLCFCWSPSPTCTASGCWLSSYFNLLEQRWSGPVPWRTSEREISKTRSARGGRSSPNTSWSWPVQSQAFGQPPVSFYRATSSPARTLYVVKIYKYILYHAHMTTEGTLWRVLSSSTLWTSTNFDEAFLLQVIHGLQRRIEEQEEEIVQLRRRISQLQSTQVTVNCAELDKTWGLKSLNDF